MEGAEINKSKKLLIFLKVTTGILCIVGFVANSFCIFEQFIGHKKITSQNEKMFEKFSFPSVTICSPSGFKKEMNDPGDLELDIYLNRTIGLNEVLVDAGDTEGYWTVDEMYKDATMWKITTTYSSFKGRCHTMQYKKEVENKYLIVCK